MRRTLNIKFLLCLLAGLTVASGGVALAHHLQYRRIPLALLRQAQKAEDENDLKRAADYIKLYLDFEQGDVEQKARLARILTSKKSSASTVNDEFEAFFLLQFVLARDPQRDDMRRLFIPLAIKFGEFDKAEDQLKLLPRDGEAAALQARWYEAKKLVDQAIESYRESIKLLPKDAETATRFARLVRTRTWNQLTPEQAMKKRESDAREADDAVDALVKAAPDSWQARLARWNYRRDYYLFERRGEKRSTFLNMVRDFLIQDAVKDVNRALELREGEADVRLAAAEAAQMEGRLDVARTHLDKAIQLHRKEPRVYKAYAGLELLVEEKGAKPDENTKTEARGRALNWLRQGTQELKPPAQTELLWAYIVLLLDTNTPRDLDEAATVINRIRVQNVTPAGGNYLQGRLLMGRQQWAEAARLLEQAQPLLAAEPELANQIDMNLGRCYEELNKTDVQYSTFKRLYDRNPGSLSARLNLAQAARAANKIDDALRYYAETLQTPDVPHGVWIDYSRLTIVKALQTHESADWKRVEQSFDDAKTHNLADAAEIAVVRAEGLMARDKPQEARNVLSEARSKSPERVELVWAAQAALEQRLKNPEEAIKILDEAERTLEKSAAKAELRLARASYWVGRHNSQTKAELLKLSQDLEKFETRDRYRLRHGLAESNYRAGNTEEAGRLWKSLAREEHYKSDLRLRLVLFDLALQEGNEADMSKLLDELHNIEGGDGAFARHAEALRLIWRVKKNKIEPSQRADTLAEAVRLLDQVAVARPTWSAALLARGEIEALRGNPDQAVAAYRKAYDLGDRSPTVLRQVVETLQKHNRGEEAERFLRSLTKEERKQSDLERSAVTIALLNDRTDEAIRLAQEAIQSESRDYRDHLWLGQMLAITGKKPDLAEESLRKAVELEKSEAETWVSLVRFLASLKDQKKTDEARTLLGEIQNSVKPAAVALALAQCYNALGDADKARDFYDQAVKARPADAAILGDYAGFRLHRNELKEAEVLVRRMLEEDVQKTPEESDWAHGRLAVLLSSGEDFTRFKEALPHVGLRMEASGGIVSDESLVRSESVTVRRLAARVLASCSLWRCREEAIKRFEELNQRQVLSGDERFILSRLYEAKGDWARAQNELSSLGTSRGGRPHHLIAHAQGLLNKAQPRAAEPIVEKLANAYKAHPWPGGDLALVELRARLLEARHEGDKAIALLREWMGRPGSDPKDVLLLVSSLGRQKRFAEALEMAEQIWKACPAEMAGGTSVALLRSVRPTEQQRKQVESLLRSAIKKEAKNVTLLVQLGDVLDLGGSYEEAENLYREALKLQPKNVMVLNNLAWLLALRTQHGEEALELINRAIDSVGPRGELLDTRSVVYLTLGKTVQARADLDEALKESPSATRYFHLARVQQAENNRDAARRTMVQANDLGLQPAQLHPVEQLAYREITEKLSQQ